MLDTQISNFAEKGDLQGVAYAEALKIKLGEALTNAGLTQQDIIDLLSEIEDFDLAGLLNGEAYGDSLTEGIEEVATDVDKSSSAIVTGLEEDVENFSKAGTNQGEAYKTAITTAFTEAIESAKSIIGSLIEYVNSQNFSVDIGVNSDSNLEGIEQFASGGGTGTSLVVN